MAKKVSVFWFRRDLRSTDNAGFFNALKGKYPVLPLFIFDSEILEKLPKKDARVAFIHTSLQKLNSEFHRYQSSIAIYHGKPYDVFKNIVETYDVQAVYTNHDYEPYAKKRDSLIHELLAQNNIAFKTFKDQVIFEKTEVVKNDGSPYVVYTPFMRKWKELFATGAHAESYPSEKLLKNLLPTEELPFPSLSDIGFQNAEIQVMDFIVTSHLISNYEKTRNFPGIPQGTSRLGPHLRFGTVSVREMIKKAISEKNEIFWNELIWREFFMQILWHFPHTVHTSFKPKYDRIQWRNNEMEFEKWKNGQTGYALVDAGMRELNATGYMHNRVRMLVASFLCKHLLIDWRWGEAYFAEKLLDYELSSNVGNWQWASGSGVDAAPYFRIFNPMTQIEKFDKQKTYIDQWVPELQELTYPPKMVDHKMARERCLSSYKKALE
ncbi:MAG: deoxyribodipyrimidine photo-lyase [Bacteroidota bacterium]